MINADYKLTYSYASECGCMFDIIELKLNQISFTLYPAHSRVERKPSVNTLRTPLSTEFWRHCVLSGRAQRRALPRHQSETVDI